MLQRVQLLLDKETRRELQSVATQENRSVSAVVREVLKENFKKKKAKRLKRGTSFLLGLAKRAVSGPGDSEYDKYAYDY